jgi:hypothetical protein
MPYGLTTINLGLPNGQTKVRTRISDKATITAQLNKILPQTFKVTYGDYGNKTLDGCPGPDHNPNTSYIKLTLIDAYSYIDATCAELKPCGGYTVTANAGVYVSFRIDWSLDAVPVNGGGWDLSESAFASPDNINLITAGKTYIQEYKIEEAIWSTNTYGIKTGTSPTNTIFPISVCPTSNVVTIPDRPGVNKYSKWTFINK